MSGKAEDGEKDGQPEEEMEYEEFEEIDEEERLRVRSPATTVKYRSGVVTLHQLLSEGILEPGERVFTIEYMGQTFTGDLLPDGRIKSLEMNQVFSSPSAWATHCKKMINPEKGKSGCGWGSVKYRGQKLDVFKTAWMKNKKIKEQEEIDDNVDIATEEEEVRKCKPKVRVPVEHSKLGIRSADDDLNTLVECTPFRTLGRIQPFTVTVSSNALLLMEFHCHLTQGQVVGYLAGHWDVVSHNVAIEEVVPVRCRLGDRESAASVEYAIYLSLVSRGLTVLGWYHSHPFQQARPSLRDLDAQMEYQIRMKGNSDASYTPCVGLICSPYTSMKTEMLMYWVMPPPEARPHEYGRPISIEYQIKTNSKVSMQLLNHMQSLRDFYKDAPDLITLTNKYKDNETYWEKMKKSLWRRFPSCCTDDRLSDWIKNLILQK